MPGRGKTKEQSLVVHRDVNRIHLKKYLSIATLMERSSFLGMANASMVARAQ